MANKKLSLYAIIIAIYTALSLLLGSFSFGLLQVRVSELLLVLCLVDKRFILPITLGCFVSNLISVISGVNIMVLDVFIGTLATFLSGVCVYMFRDMKMFNKPILSLLMPAIINGVIIGLELNIYLSVNLVLSMVYVAIGEFISVFVLGILLSDKITGAISKYIE